MTQIKSYIFRSSHIFAYLGVSRILQKSYMVRTHHELATISILVLCVLMEYISHKTEYPSFYDFVCRVAYFMQKSNNKSLQKLIYFFRGLQNSYMERTYHELAMITGSVCN